jgi:hypothetical protein
MRAIVKGLGSPRSAGENFGCTWKHLGAPATRLEAPATSLRAPVTSLGALVTTLGAPATTLGVPEPSLGVPVTRLGAPQITVNQSGNNNIFFANADCAPGNHSYYLSYNNF